MLRPRGSEGVSRSSSRRLVAMASFRSTDSFESSSSIDAVSSSRSTVLHPSRRHDDEDEVDRPGARRIPVQQLSSPLRTSQLMIRPPSVRGFDRSESSRSILSGGRFFERSESSRSMMSTTRRLDRTESSRSILSSGRRCLDRSESNRSTMSRRLMRTESSRSAWSRTSQSTCQAELEFYYYQRGGGGTVSSPCRPSNPLAHAMMAPSPPLYGTDEEMTLCSLRRASSL